MIVTLKYADIEENFKFAVIEVARQVEDTCSALGDPSASRIEKIIGRDDYIDNLKCLIENRSFAHLIGENASNQQAVDQLRSLLVITSNLEKIGDYTVKIVNQVVYLDNPGFIKRYDYCPFFDAAKVAFDSIIKALCDKDVKLALSVCQAKLTIGNHYRQNLNIIMGELKDGGNPQNLVTSLFIFQYLDRMGAALQNIGEAILFAIMGEKIKIREYRALEESLAETGLDNPASRNVSYNGIWGTRSGARIGAVSDAREGKNETSVIFKHGNREKLIEEKQSIEEWERLAPGLAPKVVSFHEDNDVASLLLEYLMGDTLQEFILNADDPLFELAMVRFLETLEHVWDTTINRRRAVTSFMAQMRNRLADVRRLHPSLRHTARSIGAATAPGIDELIKSAEIVESELTAPFTIRIHGDFNANNVIYNPTEDTIRYLDLHRSAVGDYAQDASVFMVSVFRLPVFKSTARERLDGVILRFYRFVLEFAVKHGDEMIRPRLAVGLARSFVTSSRFEYRKSFAKKMYMRGVYILEKLDANKGQGWESFTLSEEALTY